MFRGSKNGRSLRGKVLDLAARRRRLSANWLLPSVTARDYEQNEEGKAEQDARQGAFDEGAKVAADKKAEVTDDAADAAEYAREAQGPHNAIHGNCPHAQWDVDAPSVSKAHIETVCVW